MHRTKPIVLVLVHHYLPGHKSGGPIRTISNLVDNLGDEFEFRIVTSDRDALDEFPYASVALDAWNQVGKAQVYYLSPENRSMPALARLLSDTRYDVLNLNSFFDPVFTLQPLLARRLGLLHAKPVVIAPRGEFSAGALILKRWKKAPYQWVASALGLYRDLTWQASSEHEAADIRRVLGGMAKRIVVASNLAPLPHDEEFKRSSRMVVRGEPLRIVFLSRITPMKNLDFALRVLQRIPIPLQFNIYGPVRDKAYWKRCETLIADLPRHISAQYAGDLAHSEVSCVLGSHDLFFLPTRGENYGHVILESLLAGTPVLIANTTPWRNLKQAGVGWDLSLDNEQQFADKIQDAARLPDEAYGLWRNRVHCYGRERAVDPEIIASNRKLFIEAAGKSASAN